VVLKSRRRLKLLIFSGLSKAHQGDLFATKLLTPSGPAKAVQNRFAILSLRPFLCQQRKGLACRGETRHSNLSCQSSHAAGINTTAKV